MSDEHTIDYNDDIFEDEDVFIQILNKKIEGSMNGKDRWLVHYYTLYRDCVPAIRRGILARFAAAKGGGDVDSAAAGYAVLRLMGEMGYIGLQLVLSRTGGDDSITAEEAKDLLAPMMEGAVEANDKYQAFKKLRAADANAVVKAMRVKMREL